MWPKFGAKFSAGWGAVVRQGARLDLVHAVALAGKRPRRERGQVLMAQV